MKLKSSCVGHLVSKISKMNSDAMTFQANRFHQRLSDLTYVHPFLWNQSKGQWVITKCDSTNWSSYYKLPCYGKTLFVSLLFIQCIWLAKSEQKFPSHYFPFTLIEFTGFGICQAVDLICYSHGEALVLATNWSYQKGAIWLKQHLVFGKHKF